MKQYLLDTNIVIFLMVTNNVKHFTVFPTLPVEDWALQDIPSGFA